MNFLRPKWPAPANIKAAVTLRPSGLDLSAFTQLPAAPIWLRQTHSAKVIWADQVWPTNSKPEADASITNCGPTVCAVLTADCLPILLCDLAGLQVAAIHAGWRGQVAGIIEATVNTMTAPANKLLAWLGPAIGPAVYEVGIEVYEQVMQLGANLPMALFFQPVAKAKDKWLMNLYAMAKYKLQALGISPTQIFGAEWCTYSAPELFPSYRRDKTTERLATLIWFGDGLDYR